VRQKVEEHLGQTSLFESVREVTVCFWVSWEGHITYFWGGHKGQEGQEGHEGHMVYFWGGHEGQIIVYFSEFWAGHTTV
jgi:hypothetical protein